MSEQLLILDAIGQIDDAYLEQYFVMKHILAKKHRSRVLVRRWIALCAACLSVVVLVAFAGAALRGYFDPPVYLENGKIDISSLPGAQVVQTKGELIHNVHSENGDIFDRDGLSKWLKDDNTTVAYGTARNIQTIKLNDIMGRVWYITTFEIEVIEGFNNCEAGQILAVTSVSCQVWGEPEFISSLFSRIEIDHMATGLFALRNADDSLQVGLREYDLIGFADYYAISQFECDGQNVKYFGITYDLDDLGLREN